MSRRCSIPSRGIRRIHRIYRIRQIPALTFCAMLLALSSSTLHAASIRQFTPQGEISEQVQASAVFTDDMVPLGQPEAQAPFTVDCGKAKGSGRWSDMRTWTYTLERPLKSGERCDFRLRYELKTSKGAALTGATSFSFFAAGPWPRNVLPYKGSNIDENQIFLVNVNGVLDPASLRENVWCEADGVGQRIPIRIASEQERAAILAAEGRSEFKDALALSCVDRLPNGAKMQLVWGKGVALQNGKAKTEREERFKFKVREPFQANFTCTREKAGAPCSPLTPVRLDFTALIATDLARKIVLVGPDGSKRTPHDDLKEERRNAVESVSFDPPFAQNSTYRIELPNDIKDDAGRALTNAARFPLSFTVGTLPPLAKFPGRFGILEQKEGGVLPVTLRNVETRLPAATLQLPQAGHRFSSQRLTDDGDVIRAIQELAKFEQQTRKSKDDEGNEFLDFYYPRELPFLAKRGGVTTREIPKPGGSSEFEVVGIPLEKPGFYIVELESKMLGSALLASPKPMYVRTTALVTNLAVHLKRGKDNALVWVTTLDGGKPVAGAEVTASDCGGKTLWQGRTDSQGRALSPQPLESSHCKGEESFVFVSARTSGNNNDFSFVRSDWDEGIEPWRFGVETWGNYEQRSVHTVLDRPLFRAGETVSMKHIARDRGSRDFNFPDPKTLPDEAVISLEGETGAGGGGSGGGAGGEEEFKLPLKWDDKGVALSEWKIPATARRGLYRIELRGGKDRNRFGTQTGDFRVSDFRLPVFTGSIQGVPQRQVTAAAAPQVPLALSLSYLNGGAAKGVQTRVSATLTRAYLEFKDYDRFRFGIAFDDEGRNAFGLGPRGEEERLVADSIPVTLDQGGAGKLAVKLPEKIIEVSTLSAEMNFPDPNGEIQTLHGRVSLWPAEVIPGMRVRDWTSVKEKGEKQGQIEIVTVDAQGKPVADTPVKVSAKRRVAYSHRKRIVGGFYAYEDHTEFKDLGVLCSGKSDARGTFRCAAGIKDAGDIYFLAETRDRNGNVATSGESYWVYSGEDTWFAAGNQDRMDILPDKRNYRPGEKARLQVRMPFREANALVSVEAGGIIDTFVLPVSRFDPVLEIPIKPEWAPNVYVSVLAVRGRVEPLKWYSFFQWGWREPVAWFKEWWNPEQPTAMVDLAKPSFRIGLAAIDVDSDAYRIDVKVTPEKADYQPREKAKITVKATRADGKPLPASSEIAFAAVDQALLELRQNRSWDLFSAMLAQRSHQVSTATAQTQVVGKRHYGKKAVPQGGGGGRAPTRELFDTLLAWYPRVALDASGSATLTVPVNDSLTEFKAVAVATAGTGLFGTGSGSFRTRQDVQIVSGLPPVVREGDRYMALLTVRNGTARAMKIALSAQAGEQNLAAKEIDVPAGSAAEVQWQVQAPTAVGYDEKAGTFANNLGMPLVWEFSAQEKTAGNVAKAGDRLRITQTVMPAVPLTVQQATFARVGGTADPLTVPVVVPAGALAASGNGGSGGNGGDKKVRGGIEFNLSASISTPPPGVRRFFEEYPFVCLEQQSSVAVGLRDAGRWQKIVAALPTYLDADGLARYFPGEGPGSPALTAYLLDIAQVSGMALPEDSARRMESGLTAFAEGRIRPDSWAPADDLVERKLSALEALTRRGHKPLSAIASLQVIPQRLPTSALLDWYLVVKRLPSLPERGERLAAAERDGRNRLASLGGKLGFTTEKDDHWWWMMAGGDSNAFRLIEAVLDDPAWKDDLPQLAQGALLRQQRGRFSTSVANVWATLALARFGERFEKQQVSGETTILLGGADAVQAKANERRPASFPAVSATAFSWEGAPAAGQTPRLMQPWPASATAGASLQLRAAHEGTGRPWAGIQTLAAVPVTEVRSNGFKITRTVTPTTVKTPGKVSRGDIWRVRLDIEALQPLTWVVVNDPIPAGARILGEGGGEEGGRDSQIATRGEEREGNAWPSFVERTFTTFRAYYAQVPRGKFSIDYTMRLNNTGTFSLPATRVEAMYAPEVFGELPGKEVRVESD